MEARRNYYPVSRPQLIAKPPRPTANPPDATAQLSAPVPILNLPRPLSDIRELSEPSIIDAVVQSNEDGARQTCVRTQAESVRFKPSSRQNSTVRKITQPQKPEGTPPQSTVNCSSSYSSTPEAPSHYNIPQASVPRRSSSQTHRQRPTEGQSSKDAQSGIAPPSRTKPQGTLIPDRGHGRSPVKQFGLRLDAVKSEVSCREPSRTYVWKTTPTDILEFPSCRHPRIKLELHAIAPLFVGGGSVEGHVRLIVDGNSHVTHRRSLGIVSVSVDLLGFEEVPGGRRATFLALGTKVVDSEHPPPSNMVEPPNPLSQTSDFWTLIPSTCHLPFMLSLPLDTGPPPFVSKHASIRFLLCATAFVRDAGMQYHVRSSKDINVIATYDPEKALTSLSSPLTTTDVLSQQRFGRCETFRLTAGLHRQVWVSGSSIFVDIHISNRTHRSVKRMELGLERDILCYKHTPASTKEKSASQARIFERNEQTMISRSSLRPGIQGWSGVQAHSSETRTCELELPRGHATVRCGKHFEVRFFLNVTASVSKTKFVSIQLPVILIHINSLDVLPNSVAQVAAAIEEKRLRCRHQRSRSGQDGPGHTRGHSASSPAAQAELRRKASYTQGQAFAAPRKQSADRQRAKDSDMDELRQTLDSSPRKHHPSSHDRMLKNMRSNVSFKVSSGAWAKKSSGTGASVNGGTTRPLASMSRDTPLASQQSPRKATERDGQEKGNRTHSPRPPQRHRRSFSSSTNSKRSDAVSLAARSKKKLPPHEEAPLPPLGTQPSHPARHNFTVVQRHCIDPHALGLTTTTTPAASSASLGRHQPLHSDPSRPSTSLGFRERLERSRFEFQGIRRKATVESLRDKGRGWWEGRRGREGERQREKEGWI